MLVQYKCDEDAAPPLPATKSSLICCSPGCCPSDVGSQPASPSNADCRPQHFHTTMVVSTNSGRLASAAASCCYCCCGQSIASRLCHGLCASSTGTGRTTVHLSGNSRLGTGSGGRLGAILGTVRRYCDGRCISWHICGVRCTKIFLVVVNFLFLVCGLTMLTVGVLMYAADGDSPFYWKLLDGMPMVGPLVAFDLLPLIFVAIGGFVALVSFLGCCGACEDSVCFLCIYTLLLLGVLTAQIIATVVLAVYREQFYTQIVGDMRSALKYQITYQYNRTALPANKTSTETNRITTAWDIVQTEMNCCGAVSPYDFRFSDWWNHTVTEENVMVPPSCCVQVQHGVGDHERRHAAVVDFNLCQLDATLYKPEDPGVSYYLKTQGCHNSFLRWLRSRLFVVIGCVSALTLLQILHLVFACVLLTSLRRSHSDSRWYEDEYG